MHRTTVSLVTPLPEEAPVGAPVTLTIGVSCQQGCDLRGEAVEIVSDGRVLATGRLDTLEDGMWVSGEIALRLPENVGEHVWDVGLSPGEEDEDPVHEGVTPVVFATMPHSCSLAVWEVPPEVPTGQTFEVKAGVRCAAECCLADRPIEVRDEAGVTVGRGALGAEPWAGTQALFWTSMTLTAPLDSGVVALTAAFPASAAGLAHEAAEAAFGVRVDHIRPNQVLVTVVARATQTPLAGIEVRCGRYTASTDETGVAELSLPAGTFEVSIRKDGLAVDPVSVAVPGQRSVLLEANAVPTRAERNLSAFENYPWG